MDIGKLLFSYEGRTRRRDWWLTLVVMGIINWVLLQSVFPMLLGPDAQIQVATGAMTPTYTPTLAILTIVMTLVWLIPYTAVSAKRTHDRGQSAKLNVGLILFANVISLWPVVATGLMGQTLSLSSALAPTLISGIIGLYLLVVLGFLDGTPGPNAYGPSPKHPDATPETFS